MHTSDHGLILAATDLSNFLACRHRTVLDFAVAHGRLASPDVRFVREKLLDTLKAGPDELFAASYPEVYLRVHIRTVLRKQAAVDRRAGEPAPDRSGRARGRRSVVGPGTA